MASYKYRTQTTGTGSLASSTKDQIYTLDINPINSNKVTDYEIKFLVQDRTNDKAHCLGYFRGEVINDRNITPSAYVTDQDTSFIFNKTNTSSLFIPNTTTDIYSIVSQSFEFFLENGGVNSVDYDYMISVELNFIL